MSLFAGFVTLCLEGRFTQRVMLPFPGQSWFARHLPTAQCLWFPPRSGTRLARGRLSMPTIGKGIMKVVCAGGQVNGGDLESVDVSLVAAPCCCTRVDAHSSGGHQESPSLQGRYWFVSSCSTLDPRSAKNASLTDYSKDASLLQDYLTVLSVTVSSVGSPSIVISPCSSRSRSCDTVSLSESRICSRSCCIRIGPPASRRVFRIVCLLA